VGPASAPIICSGLRLRSTSRSKGKARRRLRKIDLPLAPVLADIERTGVRVTPRTRKDVAIDGKGSSPPGKRDWKLAGLEFNVNSPTQLAEILLTN